GLLPPPIERVAGDPIPPDEARDCLPAQLLLPQQPDDLLLVKPTDPHRTPPLGPPVAYVSYPLVRKTGSRPDVVRGCRVCAPRCRKTALASEHHGSHRIGLVAQDSSADPGGGGADARTACERAWTGRGVRGSHRGRRHCGCRVPRIRTRDALSP